jgi:hypothetical protein
MEHLTPSGCTHAVIMAEVERIVAASEGTLVLQPLGQSIEGRGVNIISAGNGPRTILLWSQMHGDEPTATLAILDILNLLSTQSHFPWIAQLLRGVRLLFIPMLNPDGAERRQRHNAVGIDVNRDASAAVSPEAQALLRACRQHKPEFGFNLHDQELRSIGNPAWPVALALLAPPFDPQRSLSHVRLRAMRIGAVVVKALKQFAEGRITRYADDYEVRAFGDSFQSAGVSTLLIESGQWPNDPDKAVIRKLNVIALLAAFWSIATGSYEDTDMDLYTTLPQNGELMFDLLIRGVTVRHPRGWEGDADVGVQFVRNTDNAMIKEIGDLRSCGGLEVHNLNKRILPAELCTPGATVKRQLIYDLLQIYADARGTTRSS